MIPREVVIERLGYAQITVGTSDTNFFSSDVPERKMRNIVAIFLIGDGTSRTVDIKKVKEDDTTDTIFDGVPVPPADIVPIPEKHDIMNPIIVLEGGTNLAAVASAGAPTATLIYWDNDV